MRNGRWCSWEKDRRGTAFAATPCAPFADTIVSLDGLPFLSAAPIIHSMQTTREHVGLAAGQTYRLLRWTQSVTRVDVVSGPGRSTPMAGHGDHWHYHPET